MTTAGAGTSAGATGASGPGAAGAPTADADATPATTPALATNVATAPTDEPALETATDNDDPSDPHDELLDVASSSNPARARLAFRISFILSALLIVATVGVLPFVVRSMATTVFGPARDLVYSLQTGEAVTEEEGRIGALAVGNDSFLNLGINAIDPATNTVSIIVSGQRTCDDVCPEIELHLVSAEADAGQHGMPPAVTLPIKAASPNLSTTITLPIDGNPAMYPFDRYTLKLVIAGDVANADGSREPINSTNVGQHVAMTVQDQVAPFTMEPPQNLELVAGPDPVLKVRDFAGLLLVFRRPLYLQLLTVLLVVLIGVSGALSLLTRSINELVIGIGGLILGIWGVRSILLPQPLPTLSLVEISLSLIILFMLLGLAFRSAAYFWRQSGWGTRWR